MHGNTLNFVNLTFVKKNWRKINNTVNKNVERSTPADEMLCYILKFIRTSFVQNTTYNNPKGKLCIHSHGKMYLFTGMSTHILLFHTE